MGVTKNAALAENLAREMHQSFASVLDDTLKAGRLGDEGAAALGKVKDSYSKLAWKLDEIKDVNRNPLAQEMLQKSPEKLVDFMLSQKGHDQAAVRNIMRFLGETSPAAANDIRGAVWQKLLDDSKTASGQVNFEQFSRLFQENKKVVDLVFAGQSQAKQELGDFVKVVERLRFTGDETEKGLMSLMRSAGVTFGGLSAASSPGLALGPVAGVVTALTVPRYIAKAISEPEMFQAYKTIYRGLEKPSRMKIPKLREEVKRAIMSVAARATQQLDEEAPNPSPEEEAIDG